MNEDFYYLGKITKLYSYKGEVVFYFDVDDIGEYRGLDAVFIDINGDIIPFIIEKIQFSTGLNATVKLQDVDNESDAKKLINRPLYLPISTLPKLEGNKFYYHEVIGFEVWDKQHGLVGTIESINDMAAQALFEIKDGYTEILLPVVDDFILEVNRDDKKIIVEFPDGLIDIYRNQDEE
jgi:16S rRNA processing protein RimM